MEIINGAALQDDCCLSNKKRGRLDDEFEFDDDHWKTYPCFTDPGCNLPLYLSEFAITQVNLKKNAYSPYLMNKDEFYEGVYVVNTSTLISAVNSTTYDITFLAFLPADKTTQTFVTKVVVTHADKSHPTTNIQFLSISCESCDKENNLFVHYSKPVSESDDDGQSSEKLPESDDGEDSEDLSESNQEDSEEDLSESNQKDSEEDLPESNQKHSEEDLPESNQKDSEEDLFESNQKDSKEDLSESNQQDSKENLCEFNENDFEDLYESNKKESKKNLSKFDEEDTKTITSYFLGGSKLLSQLNKNSKEGSDLSKEIDSFNDDVAKSDGFEVGYYPHMEAAGIHGTWICKFYDIENTTLSTTEMNKLVHLSQLALFVYNMKKNTNFDKIKVLKAMTSGGAGTNYNITFKASSHDKNAEIFQTRLVVSFPFPYRNVDIKFVRTKGN